MMLKFHHPVQLWQEDQCADLLDHVLYWKLARDEEDWKLISSLFRERETLCLEAKGSEQPKQQSMFDA